jgi:chemotaxis protein CheD
MRIMNVPINVSEMKISKNTDDILIANNVGSGVGILIHDPGAKIGGACHSMLPNANVFPDMARKNPHIFADTSIPLLIQNLLEQGATKERLVVNMTGGAEFIKETNSPFSVGRKNVMQALQSLREHGLALSHQAVGGHDIRNAHLSVGTGRVWVDVNKQRIELC